MVHTLGQMEENIEVTGKMENNMVKVTINKPMALKEKVSGTMERGYNGLMNEIKESQY